MKRLLLTFLVLLIGFGCSNCYGFSLKKQPAIEQQQDTQSQQAKVLYAQNDIDGAYDILIKKTEEERSAQDWLILGNIMQDKEKINEAMYMFNQSIIKDEKYYKAHYNLGYIYLAQNKPNMALNEFKLAVKYKPDFSYGYYNIGCAYLKLEKYSAARYNFFKAMDLRANEPDIYYNLAYTYKMQGKEKQANTYLDLYNKMMENHDL